MSLQIVHYCDPILRRKGEKITQFDAFLLQLSADMISTMHDAHGIGMASQQVGHALQVCVVDLRPVKIDFTWELDGAKPPLELIMPMTIVPGSRFISEATRRLTILSMLSSRQKAAITGR